VNPWAARIGHEHRAGGRAGVGQLQLVDLRENEVRAIAELVTQPTDKQTQTRGRYFRRGHDLEGDFEELHQFRREAHDRALHRLRVRFEIRFALRLEAGEECL
jgi:hypothetical protein